MVSGYALPAPLPRRDPQRVIVSMPFIPWRSVQT
jgi:hypothetical protein